MAFLTKDTKKEKEKKKIQQNELSLTGSLQVKGDF